MWRCPRGESAFQPLHIQMFIDRNPAEAIVVERARLRPALHGNPAARKVERGRLDLDALHSNRAEHVVERHAHFAQIRLVVARANAVSGVAVHQCQLDLARVHSAFVELACGAGGAPQTGEAAAKDEDSLHRLASSMRRHLTDYVWVCDRTVVCVRACRRSSAVAESRREAKQPRRR